MTDGDREILDHFIRTRDNTIELVRRIPEEFLARKPDGEDHKLSFLVVHAGCGESWWMHNVLEDGGPERHPCPDDKMSMIRAMEAARGRVVDFFSAGGGERMGQTFSYVDEEGATMTWTGRNRLLYFIDHEVHHRGKIVLALRQWGTEDIPFLPF